MGYNLFIDDMRLPQDVNRCLGRDWLIARNMEDVIRIVIEHGKPDFISFDHDMEESHYGGDYSCKRTGADIAELLVEMCGGEIPSYQVHSLNPDGPQRIYDAIKKAKATWPTIKKGEAV
jgi:hypothetical protein